MGVDNSLQLFQISITCVSVDYKQSNTSEAGIAQLVEHDLAKVGVASSSLVSRSIVPKLFQIMTPNPLRLVA